MNRRALAPTHFFAHCWVGLFAALTPLCSQTPAAPAYVLADAFPGLSFDQPLAVVSAPGEKNRLFVVEKTGRIQVVTGLDAGKPARQIFLDLTQLSQGVLETSGECGILGLAFPPDYAKTGRCYVYYSLRNEGRLFQRVSRLQVAAGDPNRLDASSEQPLWTQADPANNHNGGDLHFGPDGYLYISVGDGGAANDQFDQARFINKGFHAAILRIDVEDHPGGLPPNPHPGVPRDTNGAAFYTVPADNPFVGVKSHHGQSIDPKTVRTEIWATGLRNPWRFSFDSATGRLFVGDVGQNLYEEVDIVTKGGDYGWSYREATHPFASGPGRSLEPAGFKPSNPIFEYPRSVGISITGGVVYHGAAFPELSGNYLLADFGSGVVLALREKGQSWTSQALAKEPGIAGIGFDPRDGEVLFANLGLGKIKRLQRVAK
jgi:glucose/arabinose dehydrogenase